MSNMPMFRIDGVARMFSFCSHRVKATIVISLGKRRSENIAGKRDNENAAKKATAYRPATHLRCNPQLETQPAMQA
ncbi:MAG: hypothetical protein V4602_14545 [Pseudomonadota bacterium]